mmetsp:Transcript_19285/g.41667  ORF Transcript_19285/g.41667 Transcript_19285/m.41667 type:complete len:347 (-) Transcript_19285:213-1253(-)
MGGNAFENTKRIDKQTLDVLYKKLELVFKEHSRFKFAMPPELIGKESFGDIDIHYTELEECTKDDHIKLGESVMDSLGCETAPVDMGVLKCFLTRERYQLDLHYFDPKEFDLSLVIFGNGDFNMLLNMIIRQLGFKLNEKGLFLRSHVTGLEQDFFLSDELESIGEFLYLQPEHFDGITSLTRAQVFQVITKSPFFCSSIFEGFKQDSSHVNRQRFAKRPMLKEFLTVATLGMHEPRQLDSKEEMNRALLFFDRMESFQNEIILGERLKREVEYKNKCKKFMNGKIIQDIYPDLTGPKLGKFLLCFREECGGSFEEYYCFLENAGPVELRAKIEICYDIVQNSLAW